MAVVAVAGTPTRRPKVTVATRLDSLITHERVRNYSVIFLILGLAVFLISLSVGPWSSVYPLTGVLPDYLAHWTGARLLLDGHATQLYDVPLQRHLQDATVGPPSDPAQFAWFVSPPFVACFYALFALLPYLWSAAVWTVFSILLLATSVHLARPLAPASLRAHWGLVVLVASVIEPLPILLFGGQDSALLLFLWIAGTRLLMGRHDTTAGVVFALGLFKPQQMFIIPVVLLFQRRYRALVAWAATAAMLSGVSLLIVGPGGVWTWIRIPFNPLYHQVVQIGQAWQMQGVAALFTSVAPSSMSGVAEPLGLLVSAIILGLFVLHLVSHRTEGLPTVEVWAFAAMTTVVCSPHLLVYDLVLLFPAALFLLGTTRARATRITLVLLWALVWFAPFRHALFGALPWPLSLPNAAWSAVPLFILWCQFERSHIRRRRTSAAPRQ